MQGNGKTQSMGTNFAIGKGKEISLGFRKLRNVLRELNF